MSNEVAAPTNGFHGTELDLDATAPASAHRPSAPGATPTAAPARGTGPAGGDDPSELDEGAPTTAEFSVAFTPRQVAAGFGILAALILLVARRHRAGRRDSGEA
jgi:hypothetical protein